MNIGADVIGQFKGSLTDSKLATSLRGTDGVEDAKLRKATKEFESLFVKQMLNSMRKTVAKSGLLEGGMGEEIFEDMLYDKYAVSISESANLGISDMMFSQLSTTKPDF